MEWKTGKPCESGWYLVTVEPKYEKERFVIIDYYNKNYSNWFWSDNRVIAWAEVPEPLR